MPPSLTAGPYTIDDEGVSRLLDDGKRESVRWADLVAVRILTTDAGPWMEDHFWVLVGTGGTGCVVAGEFAAPLLPYLQRLPGFDNEAVIAAMASTDHAEFDLWKKTPESPWPGR